MRSQIWKRNSTFVYLIDQDIDPFDAGRSALLENARGILLGVEARARVHRVVLAKVWNSRTTPSPWEAGAIESHDHFSNEPSTTAMASISTIASAV